MLSWIRRCWVSSRTNSDASPDISSRYPLTKELTEVPRSAARILAALYTSSGTVTVIFFTESQ